jgi:hypothetical protein
MPCRIWLRLKLSPNQLAIIEQEACGCDLRHDDDRTINPQWLEGVDGVFTEEPLFDALLQRKPNLKWLHVTRGGVNPYLTPIIKARPI